MRDLIPPHPITGFKLVARNEATIGTELTGIGLSLRSISEKHLDFVAMLVFESKQSLAAFHHPFRQKIQQLDKKMSSMAALKPVASRVNRNSTFGSSPCS